MKSLAQRGGPDPRIQIHDSLSLLLEFLPTIMYSEYHSDNWNHKRQKIYKEIKPLKLNRLPAPLLKRPQSQEQRKALS